MSSRRSSAIRVLAVVMLLAAAACADDGEATLLETEFMRFPDPVASPYCLPYPVGDIARVSQAWGDRGTHRGRFAIDFTMPFGSEVAAARGGTVTETRTQYRDDDPTGGHENGIFVLHDDGTMAMYLHLSEGGVLAEEGDVVTTGQVIGLVGTTGTSIPHLHFEVFEGQREMSQWYRTLPVSFANVTTSLDEWGGLLRTDYESTPCVPAE
jgi:murein DD-endopeptidase MepM/ murein hydrolase activator NlpD